MLEQVCDHIHNYFIEAAFPATYSISSGEISPFPPIKEGQRFWICGSDLNDGVYTWHESAIMDDDDRTIATLKNEVFSGTIRAMAVPAAVIQLVDEISGWCKKYKDAVESPYSSENVVSVYGYTKAVKSEGAGGGAYSWQDVYKNRLNRWRKIAV